MTRREANFQIIRKLITYCRHNPDVRFTQALFNLGINEFTEETKQAITDPIYYGDQAKCILPPEYKLLDKYNEESVKTLEKLNGKI